MDIQIKRIYEAPKEEDGQRILVDRLWPRGVSKDYAKIDFWLKNIAPSNELRKWYGHNPEKWQEFKSRYFSELRNNQDGIADMVKSVGSGKATFLFGSKEQQMNNAAVLKEYIETNIS